MRVNEVEFLNQQVNNQTSFLLTICCFVLFCVVLILYFCIAEADHLRADQQSIPEGGGVTVLSFTVGQHSTTA